MDQAAVTQEEDFVRTFGQKFAAEPAETGQHVWAVANEILQALPAKSSIERAAPGEDLDHRGVGVRILQLNREEERALVRIQFTPVRYVQVRYKLGGEFGTARDALTLQVSQVNNPTLSIVTGTREVKEIQNAKKGPGKAHARLKVLIEHRQHLESLDSPLDTLILALWLITRRAERKSGVAEAHTTTESVVIELLMAAQLPALKTSEDILAALKQGEKALLLSRSSRPGKNYNTLYLLAAGIRWAKSL